MRWYPPGPKKVADLYAAHVWFAWYPVVLPSEQRVWLEWVWRRKVDYVSGTGWVYGDRMYQVERG